MSQGVNFLVMLFRAGLSYSAICVARSARYQVILNVRTVNSLETTNESDNSLKEFLRKDQLFLSIQLQWNSDICKCSGPAKSLAYIRVAYIRKLACMQI